ncbi:calcium-binding protein LPS1-alpha-like isoform X2 [Haliotis rufescens]|uniref:calcium-binding protein LPS1-alpha-like isoform X2 n=1 Tax=Haliotis rufescens TaxID=6454 RepID=UPI00201F6CD8|nr:calcium-binding protein LPS1-alpha-like isoform X2 [Haliotis rufescens]
MSHSRVRIAFCFVFSSHTTMLLLLCLTFVGLCAGQGNFHDQYAKVFESKVDTNNNKMADVSEFKAIFDSYDLNKDGQVPVAEYEKATGGVGAGPAAFFALLDPNSDGVIHRTEVPAILNSFDVNGNGKVTEEEFLKHYGDLYNKVLAMQISVGK